jgi:cytoskeletal protein CcmA (bactofilin family)
MPPRVAEQTASEKPLQLIDVLRLSPAARSDQVGPRTLIVGSGVLLCADIDFCDRLVVGGDLEASVHECRQLEISLKGKFRGNATVATADIAGQFKGDLVVRKRLVVRSTGHVSGSITYREIEIEAGAEVAGILMPERKTGTSFLPAAFATRRQDAKTQD